MAMAMNLGGSFTFPNTSMTVARMGYGAMQLAGPHVFGPPKDWEGAVAVMREVVAAGVNHIDTSDFYGPHVTNQIIREALHPYADNLVIVTKLGALRGAEGSWLPAHSRQALIDGTHDNLRNLKLERLQVVNLRVGPPMAPAEAPVKAQMEVLAELQQGGLIEHIGLSNVTASQVAEAQGIAKIVCVQNNYNVVNRSDDALIDLLAQQGIPYVPFFPLGGFSPLQSAELNEIAASLEATPMQVALAWLLHRSPNLLLIPGTKSSGHLKENLAAAVLQLPAEAMARLNAIGTAGTGTAGK